jgi:hypothetical protein
MRRWLGIADPETTSNTVIAMAAPFREDMRSDDLILHSPPLSKPMAFTCPHGHEIEERRRRLLPLPACGRAIAFGFA